MSENPTPKPVPRPNGDTQPFWDACNEERLVYQSCQSCGHAQFYPRSACVKCESTDLAWQEAKPAGTVHTFTIVNRAPSPAFRGDVPYVLALIDLTRGDGRADAGVDVGGQDPLSRLGQRPLNGGELMQDIDTVGL